MAWYYPPNIPLNQLEIARSQIDRILTMAIQIRHSNIRGVNKLEDELAKLEYDTTLDEERGAYYREKIGDNYDYLEDVLALGSQLIIVGLYRIVEQRTKSIVNAYLHYIYNPGIDKGIMSSEEIVKKVRIKIKSISNIDKLIDLLNKQFSLNIENVDHYTLISELRCLNNAIKHDEKPNDNLKNYVRWKDQEEIGNVEDQIDRFAKVIPEYIYSLCKGIDDYVKPPSKVEI